MDEGSAVKVEMLVAEEALGERFTIVGHDGREVTVTIPGLPTQEPEPYLVGPGEWECQPPALSAPPDTQATDPLSWGTQWTTEDSYLVEHVHVSPTPDNATTREELIEQWLDAYAPEPGSPRTGTTRPSLTGTTLREGRLNFMPLRGHPYAPLSLPQVRTLLRLAYAGERLPLPWALIVDARRALYSDPRRAVMDLCTAVEVAYETYISDHLATRGVPSRAVGRILRSAAGVSAKVALARDLDAPRTTVSAAAVNNEIAGVRNLAAHAAAEPDMKERKQMYVRVHELVRAVSPLPAADEDPPART